MKIRTFIDRPILAGVISVVFLIIGLIGLSQLPVEQFPFFARNLPENFIAISTGDFSPAQKVGFAALFFQGAYLCFFRLQCLIFHLV